ncbi:amidase family protein [Actinocrispum wychmicini]|uniref:Mandelamide amidase n=1 Tax=Actinocrispum wychmicini TaxID=1213861 RepID=A0A4R2JBV9_9PSEU|nr:amidase family protein [Actinocrispum wychmicini]TCO54208.1 mandelamide amidase [Actinocrispum wychmicini]
MSLREWLDIEIAGRRERVGGCVDRAKETTASHGAWITVGPRSTADDGPLAGVPLAVKDNIDVAGLATTAGSPLFADAVAETDAGVVSVLKSAGATVLGKTNLHELGFGITSNNATFGPVRHPWHPARSAGGSSGGSAVAVALDVVPVSLGTDTGGSVTIPASFCGIVGFRPSTGRYPGDGVVNLSYSRDTVGVHARTARDVRIIDEVITSGSTPGAPGELEGLRIGVPASRYRDVDPRVTEVVRAALATLTAAGAQLVEVEVRDDLTLAAESGDPLVLFEFARLLRQRLLLTGSPLAGAGLAEVASRISSPDVRALLAGMASAPVTVERYTAARDARWRLREAYREAFERSGADVLAWPTCPVLPPLIGEDDTIMLHERPVPLFPTVIRNTEPGTVAGQPAVSLPAGTTADDLPVGLCLEGRVFDDERLLRIAVAVEDVLPRNDLRAG